MGDSMTSAACQCAPYSVSYSTFSKRQTDPGRLLAPGELVPCPIVDFIGRPLGLDGDDLAELHRLWR